MEPGGMGMRWIRLPETRGVKALQEGWPGAGRSGPTLSLPCKTPLPSSSSSTSGAASQRAVPFLCYSWLLQPTASSGLQHLPAEDGGCPALLHFTSKPTLFFFCFCTPALPRREQDRLCRAGSGSTLGAAAPQDGWDVTLVSGATPAPGERSWKMVSLSIRTLSGSKAVRGGRRGSRSPAGAAQKRGRDGRAASPSAGRLVLPFLGQQSAPSPALAVVLQSHCTAYPFLKSTPHKYFVKHLLANVLFF